MKWTVYDMEHKVVYSSDNKDLKLIIRSGHRSFPHWKWDVIDKRQPQMSVIGYRRDMFILEIDFL